ncbi:MAG: amino acid transporter [Cyanobacteria bacterium HKST-UBA02]|nr:amino acid transporter [Cyanobacteria bacterium HKST-UBA02]
MIKKLEGLRSWLFEGHLAKEVVQENPWWKVMCLTGVGYFSSMGFQPGLALVAAGVLSPLASANLVLVTWLAALPTFWLVARSSPHGHGAIDMLERLLKGWSGKTLVLIVLGFAATDFIFTITMCAADATAHIVENPLCPAILKNHVAVTLVLILFLGAIFLRGFREAVLIACLLVLFYLGVNVVLISTLCAHIIERPELLQSWGSSVQQQYGSTAEMLGVAALAFPQLALGLSGFETSVAVMPLISAMGEDSDLKLEDRVRKTRYLLLTLVAIMTLFLLGASLVTTLLIKPSAYVEGGEANGRALAYLSHVYLGDVFGSIYDLATVSILWFAGASAMAALLSLAPHFLPRYGMAPAWAAAKRPLILFFTLVSLAVTITFRADVDAQAGAFATGLLVMLTAGSVAVTLTVWKERRVLRLFFVFISLVFVYSSVNLVVIRPDGLAIAMMMVAAILFGSLLSRALRSTELRIGTVVLDRKAESFIKKACNRRWGEVRLLAHKFDIGDDYDSKEADARKYHSIQKREGDFIFFEVIPRDVSDFMDDKLEIEGLELDGHEVLRCSAHSVPNAIAATLLHIRNSTGRVPHVYLGWTEGHPIAYMFKYILFGEGETAPLTREILRGQEPDPDKRPRVHVG